MPALRVEGRDEAQMETHVSMTGELREELTRKFNLSFTPAEGKIVWTH